MGGHPPRPLRPLNARYRILDATAHDDCIQNAGEGVGVEPLSGAVAGWLDGDGPQPARDELARAVRLSLRALARVAPGATVEVRVPPFAAVQCVAGPKHTRGTPPNLVETDPRTWLELATGRITWAAALAQGQVAASGSRADVSGWLPLVPGRSGAGRGGGRRGAAE